MQSPGAQLQSCPINFSLTHFQHSQTPQHVPFLFLFPLPRPYTKQSDLLYLRVNKNTCTIAPGPTPSTQSTLSVLILHVPVKQILPILQDPFYCHFLPEAFSVPHNYLFDFLCLPSLLCLRGGEMNYTLSLKRETKLFIIQTLNSLYQFPLLIHHLCLKGDNSLLVWPTLSLISCCWRELLTIF